MQAEKLQRFYDRRAPWYDIVMGTFGYTSSVRHGFAHVEMALPPEPRVLDVGCGTGAVSQAVLRRYPGASLTGMDLSREMLSQYVDNFPDARVLYGDFNEPEKLVSFPGDQPDTLEPESFDLVVSAGAVSEHGRLDIVIPFLSGLIAPGGMFINLGVNRTLLTRIIAIFSWRYQPVVPERFYETCRDAGFVDIQASPPKPGSRSRYFVASMRKPTSF